MSVFMVYNRGMDTEKPTKTKGRPVLVGMDKYTVRLPVWLAEWAKQNGGLSEILRDGLEQRYRLYTALQETTTR